MAQVVDFLAFKKKKEEEAAWDYLQSGAIFDPEDADYIIKVLENMNKDYPGTFEMLDDNTIYISLDDNDTIVEDKGQE